MTPARKAPHCRTCLQPLKGHKRGTCGNVTNSSPIVKPSSLTPPRSESPKRPGSAKKAAPLPLEPLPTLSPRSSQILDNVMRINSHSAPPIVLPQVKRSASEAETETEPSHVAFERLSVKEEESKTPNISTKVESQSPDVEAASPSTSEMPQQPQLQQSYACDVTLDDKTIQNLLDSTPAAIFTFPADAILGLEACARRLEIFVCVFPSSSTDGDWVPVVMGRNALAVKKLLEDSEPFAQATRKLGVLSVGEFNIGLSHIVAGTLGALATWAGLAYT